MTVDELIARLMEYPVSLPVAIDVGSGEDTDLRTVDTVQLVLMGDRSRVLVLIHLSEDEVCRWCEEGQCRCEDASPEEDA